MKKIYPLGVSPSAWLNFSNHLNILYNKIQSYMDYLNYFQPTYRILNESMKVCNANTLEEEYLDVFIEKPEWEYSIIDNKNVVVKTVYCYFPSELNANEGYLNTHYESYLIYDAPPDAYMEPASKENRKQTISEKVWNEGIASGKIQYFPISRVIMAKEWHGRGVQSNKNPAGFVKENYLIISKPSACWYVPSPSENGIAFDFVDHAMETAGSLVPLQFLFSPSRYSFFDSGNGDTWECWTRGSSEIGYLAVSWNSATEVTPSRINIANSDMQFWTETYPLMHRLEFWDKNDNNLIEEFIADDIFQNQKTNLLNHITAKYQITLTSADKNDITDLWEQCVKIMVC